MQQPSLRAFIFDMDGTLVNNTEFHTRTWLKLLGDAGVTLDADEFHRQSAGRTTTEIIRQWIGNDLSDEAIAEYSLQKEVLYRDTYRPHLKAIEGLHTFLEGARSHGIAMALATSARSNNINFVLDGLQIRDYFSAVVGAEDITRGKPHPEIFLTAARQLSVSPQNCVVFEDAEAGIEAAERAGMKCVVITTTLDESQLARWPHVEAFAADFRSLDAVALAQ
jgi:beta-phosphoglucomutase family hydrolase